MDMKVDFIGRVDHVKLPTTKPLLPLMETIINSIHAMKDLEYEDGLITVHVDRDTTQTKISEDEYQNQPIKNVTVVDNGVGFNQRHMVSFSTSDTRLKESMGGKGIGRFLWLKAFKSVHIESVFYESDEWKHRKFDFRLSEVGIHDHEMVPSVSQQRKTTVKLIGFIDQYQRRCPKRLEAIAQKVIEHCLKYFLQPNCPQIKIDDGKQAIDLNQMFDDRIKRHQISSTFAVKGFQFSSECLRLYSHNGTQHKLYLCADNREVLNENIKNHIPELSRRLKDENEKSFVFSVYVSGKYLDKNVNPERTGFEFAEADDLDFPDEIKKEEFYEETVNTLKSQLDPYLSEIREEKDAYLRDYVYNKAPEYRVLLKPKYKDFIDQIPPNLTESNIELKLHEIKSKVEVDLKKQATELIGTKIQHSDQIAEYKTKYEQFLEESNEIGKSDLAKYIIHRKTILDLLDNNLRLNADGKYSLEDSIHMTIFPLRRTSDDIDYDKQNLWIIDEKLAYHRYLASDKPMRSIDITDVDSSDRADLIIFNDIPFAFVDSTSPYTSVVIVEFKRPGRTEYSEKENPINQVYNYCEQIQNGTVLDKTGRPINVSTIPFYGYIICDLSDKIRNFAKNAGVLASSPDNRGYFGYNPEYRCYIEIISYDKLIDDAKKRNRILFDKLKLPIS